MSFFIPSAVAQQAAPAPQGNPMVTLLMFAGLLAGVGLGGIAFALAAQDTDGALKSRFSGVAEKLAAKQEQIVAELLAAQGRPVDIGGYYRPDPALTERQMRPSATLNAIIDAL